MNLGRFHVAAAALITFNVVGTVLTWTTHLSKPGTSNAHAVLNGTEFTGPLFFIAIWIAATLMTVAAGRTAMIGTWVMTLFAAGYAFGDITELAKHNVGVTATKWHVIIALDVVGLAFALTAVVVGIMTIASSREAARAQNGTPMG